MYPESLRSSHKACCCFLVVHVHPQAGVLPGLLWPGQSLAALPFLPLGSFPGACWPSFSSAEVAKQPGRGQVGSGGRRQRCSPCHSAGTHFPWGWSPDHLPALLSVLERIRANRSDHYSPVQGLGRGSVAKLLLSMRKAPGWIPSTGGKNVQSSVKGTWMHIPFPS